MMAHISPSYKISVGRSGYDFQIRLKSKLCSFANFQRTGVYDTFEVRQLNGLKWRSRKSPDSLTWYYCLSVWGGIVCVGCNRNLYGLDSETGKELWKYQLGKKFFSSPVVSDGIVYVSSLKFNQTLTKQYLRAVNIKTGQQL